MKTLLRGLAPIQDALDHPDTTEIVIQKPGEVGILQNRVWAWREVPEFTFNQLDAICMVAGTLLSKSFDAAHPIVETTLPDGQRFTGIRPPVTLKGRISITIRNPSKRKFTIYDDDFQRMVTATTHHKARKSHPADGKLLSLYKAKKWTPFFSLAVRAHKSIGAVGVTDSGKTTLLRRLMRDIPDDERVVTIEDTEEFQEIPARNRVELIYGSSGITAEKLCETSLRLRPDRVAMQELRGPEAFAYLRMHAAGLTGGLTSWHAEESNPFGPLSLMVKTSEAGRNIPDDALNAMLRRVIDIVAYCQKDPLTKEMTISSVYYSGAENAQ